MEKPIYNGKIARYSGKILKKISLNSGITGGQAPQTPQKNEKMTGGLKPPRPPELNWGASPPDPPRVPKGPGAKG